jgi:hypothetical protein
VRPVRARDEATYWRSCCLSFWTSSCRALIRLLSLLSADDDDDASLPRLLVLPDLESVLALNPAMPVRGGHKLMSAHSREATHD